MLCGRRIISFDNIRRLGETVVEHRGIQFGCGTRVSQCSGVFVHGHGYEDGRKIVIVHSADAHRDLLAGLEFQPGLFQQSISQVQSEELCRCHLRHRIGEDFVFEQFQFVVRHHRDCPGGNALVFRSFVDVVFPAQFLGINGREYVFARSDIVPPLVNGAGTCDADGSTDNRHLSRGHGACFGWCIVWSVLHDRMVVDPSEPTGGYCPNALAAGARLPRGQLRGNRQCIARILGPRSQFGEPGQVRNLPVLHANHGLDQPGHSGRGFEMADLRFDATQVQRVLWVPPRGIDLGDGIIFVGIAHNRGGGVGFQELHFLGVGLGLFQCMPESLCATLHRGCIDGLPGTVAGRADSPDHPANTVPIGQRVFQAFKHDHAHSLADDQAICGVVEGVGMPGLAESVYPAEADVDCRIGPQISATGDRHSHITGHQGLAGHVQGHERRCTRCIHRHVGPFDAEHLCDTIGYG